MSTSIRTRRRARLAVLSSIAALVVLAAVVPVGATPAGSNRTRHRRTPVVRVLQTGLDSPKGLDTFMGVPIVSQGAYGPEGPGGAPGPVVASVRTRHGQALRALSEPIALTDVAVGPGLSLWGLGADQHLYHRTAWSRSFVDVADIAAYQVTDPDPYNTEGDPAESNPFGLAALPNGDALVADAAGNDLLRITPRGRITTVARFAPEMVSTDLVPASPDSPPLPPALATESVPTSIAVTPNGVLVGELKGFPFRPGSSRIWKVDPNATGALCSVEDPAIGDPAPDDPTPDGVAALRGDRRFHGPRHRVTKGCSQFAADFSSIADLAYDRHTRSVFVYQFAAGGVGEIEAALGGLAPFPAAVLTELRRDGTRRELVAGQLFQPGGVTVDATGQLYVTDNMFGAGRLLRIDR